MARKSKAAAQRKERRSRKKAAAGKRRPRKRSARREVSYNPLLVLVMFLYMLGLIEKRTLTRIQAALSPKKKAGRRRRPKTTVKPRRTTRALQGKTRTALAV